jgi:hypothetical protein
MSPTRAKNNRLCNSNKLCNNDKFHLNLLQRSSSWEKNNMFNNNITFTNTSVSSNEDVHRTTYTKGQFKSWTFYLTIEKIYLKLLLGHKLLTRRKMKSEHVQMRLWVEEEKNFTQ